MTREESTFIQHEPCPKCGSRNNLARYSDGHATCFSAGCDHYEPADGEFKETTGRTRKVNAALDLSGEIVALRARKITEETTRKFQYRVGQYGGNTTQFALYVEKDGSPCGQKTRDKDKNFFVLGDLKKALLYGQQLWAPGGKRVVITEGEIDCMTVSQLQGNKWPVVSLKRGSKSAKKDIQEQLEWLCTFDEVVLMFDMDEPGQLAVAEAAPLFPPGKCKVASLPFKDANECLLEGKGDAVIQAIWQAREYRPDGILAGDEITLEELLQPIDGYDLPYPLLNEMLMRLRAGELTLLTAGSGIGKSTFAREIAFHLHQAHGLTIGNVYLEENVKKTAQGYIAIHNNVPLGRLRKEPDLLSKEQWDKSLEEIIHKRMFFYKHFGSMESDNLLGKLRYMRVALGCDFVVLDHISIVVSGAEGSGQGERKDIDVLMTNLRSLVEETGLGIIAIVHLRQPEGAPHEEGGRVTLSQLRGSGSLKQLSDNVIALERDQQGDNKNSSKVRVLKCRETGETGEADTLDYDRETGRMVVGAGPSPFPSTSGKDEDDDCPF